MGRAVRQAIIVAIMYSFPEVLFGSILPSHNKEITAIITASTLIAVWKIPRIDRWLGMIII
jgi:hypothetical protein